MLHGISYYKKEIEAYSGLSRAEACFSPSRGVEEGERSRGGRSDDGKTERPSLTATSFSGPAAVAQVTAGDLPQQVTEVRESGGLELLY